MLLIVNVQQLLFLVNVNLIYLLFTSCLLQYGTTLNNFVIIFKKIKNIERNLYLLLKEYFTTLLWLKTKDL